MGLDRRVKRRNPLGFELVSVGVECLQVLVSFRRFVEVLFELKKRISMVVVLTESNKGSSELSLLEVFLLGAFAVFGRSGTFHEVVEN